MAAKICPRTINEIPVTPLPDLVQVQVQVPVPSIPPDPKPVPPIPDPKSKPPVSDHSPPPVNSPNLLLQLKLWIQKHPKIIGSVAAAFISILIIIVVILIIKKDPKPGKLSIVFIVFETLVEPF